VPRATARVVVVVCAGALILPFCVSVLRTTHRFARRFSEVAVRGNSTDLGRQPRLVVEAAVRLVGVLIAGLALIAITQPFLPGYTAAIVLIAALLVLTFLFWRTATGLQGHVRAVAQALIEVLGNQRGTPDSAHADPLEQTHDLFPGLGAPIRFEVKPDSPSVGCSLADLDLRSATGATVLAIVRGTEGMAVPDAHVPLVAGDILALAGTAEAIEAATTVLDGGCKQLSGARS
jgi:CPA2 family monovalent cation:H+ antiporter-2